jgi:hypothetical protein
MIYFLDFGSLRYPLPMHNKYREKYGKKFYTIRNYTWENKGLMLMRAKEVWFVKEAVSSKIDRLVGDIICMSLEAFQEVVNEYKNILPVDVLTLQSTVINNVTVYFLCIKKTFIGGIPAFYEDVLFPSNLMGRNYDSIKLGNYDKNISIYEN